MKKIILLLMVAFTLIISTCLLSSCHNKAGTDTTKECSDDFFEKDNNEIIKTESKQYEIFTYQEAYELFEEVYSWGTHADYIEYVNNEANKMKNEVVRVYNEIIDILKGKYQSITDGPGPHRSYSDYYKSFILPFETYYNSRMEAAEQVQEAYLGISDILTYGGNAGGDGSVLWKYVHYRNLYNELCDLKNFIE